MEGVNLIGGFAQYCVSRHACLSMPCLVVEEEEAFFPEGSVQVSFAANDATDSRSLAESIQVVCLEIHHESRLMMTVRHLSVTIAVILYKLLPKLAVHMLIRDCPTRSSRLHEVSQPHKPAHRSRPAHHARLIVVH